MTNASSIFQGQFLSNLFKGPDLLSNLVRIILRFSEIHIAKSADIEQMFMQVKVATSFRSYLGFLWDHNGKIEEYEYTSHIFGATSSPCIASYALRSSAKDNQKYFHGVSHIVERNIYMDDLYISTDDVEKAVNIMSSTKACLSLPASGILIRLHFCSKSVGINFKQKESFTSNSKDSRVTVECKNRH